MDTTLQILANSLREASERYHTVIVDKLFDYNNRKKNIESLSLIVERLRNQAKSKIRHSEDELEIVDKKLIIALEKRSELYKRFDSQKKQLSEIGTRSVGITKEIGEISEEITYLEYKKSESLDRLRREEKKRDDWNAAFYATCWIPFVNIGTGIKKYVVDEGYYTELKILGGDINAKQRRIETLNSNLNDVRKEMIRCNQSSSELANQITQSEGEIAAITTVTNDLRRGKGLWEAVLMACTQIDVELQHTNGKIENVMKCFDNLLQVEEMLELPTTDKYIKGCKCKGDTLLPGQYLYRNEYLLSSNRRFVAMMKSDNNFGIYNSEQRIWVSDLSCSAGNAYVTMQQDGIVTIKGYVILKELGFWGGRNDWSTKRPGGAMMVMQDDGNLVVYDKNHNPLWASDTYTYANVPSICFNKH